MAQSDQELVGLCRDGHPEIFRNLVTRYETSLLRHLTGRLGNRHNASEATQETFVRAYFSLERLRNTASFSAWLFGIADRVALEMRRSDQKFATAVLDDVAAEESGENAETGQTVDATLFQTVQELPDTYRNVVLLRFYGGQSCEDIAENLSIPLGTVTSRLSRAYVLLRQKLAALKTEGE